MKQFKGTKLNIVQGLYCIYTSLADTCSIQYAVGSKHETVWYSAVVTCLGRRNISVRVGAVYPSPSAATRTTIAAISQVIFDDIFNEYSLCKKEMLIGSPTGRTFS